VNQESWRIEEIWPMTPMEHAPREERSQTKKASTKKSELANIESGYKRRKLFETS
jgi:hypothetical protein